MKGGDLHLIGKRQKDYLNQTLLCVLFELWDLKRLFSLSKAENISSAKCVKCW
jgi:hypothetical protein